MILVLLPALDRHGRLDLDGELLIVSAATKSLPIPTALALPVAVAVAPRQPLRALLVQRRAGLRRHLNPHRPPGSEPDHLGSRSVSALFFISTRRAMMSSVIFGSSVQVGVGNPLSGT
ncbi:hypothetical protein E9232_000721 [Inquilinus ginsengisoli]|uniref:Uncharacterized protein n=1 Tax=Inquilinus ginsengisoli TaxID=363840 RepID=A0ABU1JIU2_9PROT|nr:hypothetical protein [Inquilinus ginsengisoli]MDR6288222.1 hypothetical protein [Inquilinus ginsengisoli]